jgi:hypothetical protein
LIFFIILSSYLNEECVQENMQQTPDLPDYEFPETSGKNAFAYMYEKKDLMKDWHKRKTDILSSRNPSDLLEFGRQYSFIALTSIVKIYSGTVHIGKWAIIETKIPDGNMTVHRYTPVYVLSRSASRDTKGQPLYWVVGRWKSEKDEIRLYLQDDLIEYAPL